MPALNHINLPVADVASLRDFFVQHFGFAPLPGAPNSPLAVLRGTDGFVLNIMPRHADDPGGFPRDFHIGFLFPTPEEVHATYARLVSAGVRSSDVTEMNRRGVRSSTLYCFAPNDVMVEVSCYTDAPDSSDRDMPPE